MDCLVRVVLGLGKQVGLVIGFGPDCTGTELSSFYSLYDLTLVQSPEIVYSSWVPRTGALLKDCVSYLYPLNAECQKNPFLTVQKI